MGNNGTDLLSTSEAADRAGVTPSALVKAVASGRLRPAQKLPGRTGAYLFRRRDIERYAQERAA